MPTLLPFKEAMALAKQKISSSSTTTTNLASTMRIFFSGQMNFEYSIQGSTLTIGTTTSSEKTTFNQINHKETTADRSTADLLSIAGLLLLLLCLVFLFAYVIHRFTNCYKKHKSIQKEAANVSRATNCNMVRKSFEK
jgi:hypothetical protein